MDNSNAHYTMVDIASDPWSTAASRSIFSQLETFDEDEYSMPSTLDAKTSAKLISAVFRLPSPPGPNTSRSTDSNERVCASDLLCECSTDGRLLGSATAYILKWSKVAIRKLANVYLTSPVLLALAPLLAGLAIGFCLGRYFERRKSGARKVERGSVRVERRSLLQSVGCPLAWMFVGDFLGTARHVLSFRSTKPSSLEVGCISGNGNNRNRIDDTEKARTEQEAGKECSERERRETTVVEDEEVRDDRARTDLLSPANTTCESGVDPSCIPKHIAVIMDGNRRYGRAKYGSATRGHWDGSRTLVDFAKWCIAEGVGVLTVYAFSTENWNRNPSEVEALMKIFVRYCEELREEALKRDIRLKVLSTETERIPDDVRAGLRRMEEDTRGCSGLLINICLSYGGRGEIVNACQSIADECCRASNRQREHRESGQGDLHDSGHNESKFLYPNNITEEVFSRYLLTGDCPDPDVVIRTSGEFRLSNFLLWQLAYSEMFFLSKPWPALTKADLVEVIRAYAGGRKRRFGK